MSVTLAHPTGNRNVRAILESLQRHDCLGEFATTLAIDSKSSLLRSMPGMVGKEMSRRCFPIPRSKIWTRPQRELARMLLPKLGFGKAVRHESGWASVDAVYRDLDRAVARRLERYGPESAIDAVYAYEDGALEIFKVAKKLGLKCVYDLPIAYWEAGRRLMMEEAARLPAWASTLGGGISASVAKLERKTKELELADVVVGPGSFVMDSLPGWTATKKKIISPFGSPSAPELGILHQADRRRDERRKAGKPLRVLFAGSMGQRKGLGDLFAAIRLLKRSDVELVVMGSLLETLSFYRKELPEFTYKPGRPHLEVLELMRSCDVFCLPSIVEGRALVMQEAMSQGLPLIITTNTGGDDLIFDAITGFLVPIRSPERIAERIDWFCQHRDDIPEMSLRARHHAATYTWDAYGDAVVNGITEFASSFQ